jgi:hypothetical protein
MTAPAPATLFPLALLASFTLAALGLASAGCTGGTTPVCDDAGSCLIMSSGSDAAPEPETGSSESGGGGDAGGD